MNGEPGRSGAGSRGFRFVGRDAEQRRLRTAAAHPPGVVIVEGEAGIGKSRLVREAAAQLGEDGRRVLIGACHPLREPLPYGPVVDAVRRALPGLPAGLPPPAPALASLLLDGGPAAPEGGPKSRRLHLLHAVREFLAALGPAVLVVEDVHWIDDGTRDLLLLLARDLPDGLSLVLTQRPEDHPGGVPALGTALLRQPGTGALVLSLDRLAESDVRDLTRSVLGERATSDLVAALHRRGEGLPLVVEEDLLTLLAQPGRADDAARLREADVPRSLREAVAERLLRLPADAAAVAEAAAALAAPSAEAVIGAVAGLDEERGAAGLVEALHASVLREYGPDRYAFRHVLARQAVYERTPGPVRRRLHRQALRVLAELDPPPLVQIAHHARALGDRPHWQRSTEAAVHQALALGDTGTAAALLRQLLAEPGLDSEARARAARSLAPIAAQGVDFYANAVALRAILADRQLPPAVRGEIRTGLGSLLLNQAADREGMAELARAVEEIGPDTVAAVPAMLALVFDERQGPESAERWIERAERAVRGSNDRPLAADVRATRLTLAVTVGRPVPWEELDRIPRGDPDPGVVRQTARALYNVGENVLDYGHDRRAAALVAEALELARRTSFPAVELHAEVTLLRLEVLAGRWEGLPERFEALAAAHPDSLVVAAERTIASGTLALARGLSAQAVDVFDQAAVTTSERLMGGLSGRTAAGAVAVRAARGEHREAWESARAALAAVRQAGHWMRAGGLVPAGVAAALACGERAAAEELTAEVTAALDGRDAPAAAAELHTARGLLAEADAPRRAAAEHHAARLAWQEIGRPYETARAAEAEARALAGADRVAAAAALAFAAAAYAGLGATADLARARALGQERGLRPKSSPGRRGYGSRLSPREREVAELLARRATNQEIATALVLSPRTVEHHVANVLKKLATTREAVAAALRAAS
ncbi:helix-turn-helix transcriptional regulator [Kitasatospora cineracea]|uniref:helix-turn-helix transcriptional regulator n=1 Tax=Kitasatospora cineracea TaxID=88074 RepID=UPI000F4619C4|nr:LuxR family transcriptional regulator [Kitasatospora cineracea]